MEQDQQYQITINNLRSQIHKQEARHFKICKFLRALNKDENSISDAHVKAFVRIMDEMLPNG